MNVLDNASLQSPKIYEEFLRVPVLSLGLCKHGVGEDVPQQPHGEDEAFFVASGRGTIAGNGIGHPVASGSVVYVPKEVAHHFHSMTGPL